MKALARVLEITGFCAVFVVCAFVLRFTIDPGECIRIDVGPIEWAYALVMITLVLGYGAASRREFTNGGEFKFWVFSTLFFGASAWLLKPLTYSPFASRWKQLEEVFSPELEPGYALEAIAPFISDVVEYWMPFASAMSLVAAIISLLGVGRNRKAAKRAGAGKPAARSGSDLEGDDLPQPESEGRSQ